MIHKKIKKFFNTVSVSNQIPFVNLEEKKNRKPSWMLWVGIAFGAVLVASVLKLVLDAAEHHEADV